MALHPAVTASRASAARVVNAARRRYGAVNGAGLAAVTAGWIGAGGGEVRDRKLD
jgi:hypothetical protein